MWVSLNINVANMSLVWVSLNINVANVTDVGFTKY